MNDEDVKVVELERRRAAGAADADSPSNHTSERLDDRSLRSLGAWVKLERQAALVALDREGVRALGLDGGARWETNATVPSAPLEVHLAVTSRCAVGCGGCYLDARPDGIEPERRVIERALDGLQRAGVFTVAFGGGEPTVA